MKIKSLVIFTCIILTMTVFLSGCTVSNNNSADITEGQEEPKVLTIYNGRQEKFIIPMVEKFEKDTGIKVNLISGKATEYAHRIIEEGENTQADLFLSNDGGILEYLRIEDMLLPIESKLLEEVPENYVGKDKTWTALTIRYRIFIYNTDLITLDEMPDSIFDLTDPKYKGQFVMNRAGNESMITYFASIQSIIGPEKTLELLKGIMANEPLILQSHTDVRRAVGSGEVKFGLVNNYHYKMQLLEEGMNHVAMVFPDQEESEMGAFANVSGAAIPKYSKHPQNALKFIEYLLKPEQQRMNDETPIIRGIEGIEYEDVRAADTSLSEVGPLWEKTTDLMEKAGYSE